MDERKGSAVTGTYPHAPGFVAGDRPRIVTSRFEYADSHTLERYLATDGYSGLRAALKKPATEVHDQLRRPMPISAGQPILPLFG